jgi:hypothetical protein
MMFWKFSRRWLAPVFPVIPNTTVFPNDGWTLSRSTVNPSIRMFWNVEYWAALHSNAHGAPDDSLIVAPSPTIVSQPVRLAGSWIWADVSLYVFPGGKYTVPPAVPAASMAA